VIIQARSGVLGNKLTDDLWVEVTQGRISDISQGFHVAPDTVIEGTLIPGFIDIHAHGGGGSYFSAHSTDEIEKVIATHRSFGTTGIVASLVTESIEDLKNQILRLIPFFVRGEILGIHLEGPYLSHARCGAHKPSLLLEPKIDQLKELIALGKGAIQMITVAPELNGASEAIKFLVNKGIKVAIGHTDGNYSDAAAGTDSGATIVTHFLNAMSKERDEKSIANFVLNEERLLVELILDGHHVPFEIASEILTTIGSRVILISDAMAAAGSTDGEYVIGELPVQVRDGVARLASNSKLAGSTITVSQSFINAIHECGISLVHAVKMATTNPAQALGITDRGAIRVGMRADLLEYQPNEKKVSLINL